MGCLQPGYDAPRASDGCALLASLLRMPAAAEVRGAHRGGGGARRRRGVDLQAPSARTRYVWCGNEQTALRCPQGGQLARDADLFVAPHHAAHIVQLLPALGWRLLKKVGPSRARALKEGRSGYDVKHIAREAAKS